MPKGYKIKRYNRIYRARSPKKTALQVAGMVAAVFVLAFIGWNVYGPVRDYLSGALAANAQNTPSGVSSEAMPVASEPEEEPTVIPAKEKPSSIKAIYLPTTTLLDETSLDNRLADLDTKEINAVMIDLKDANGNLLYRSSAELVAQAGAQVENAYDLSAICQKFEEHNLFIIGRVNAFKDPVAASRIPDAGIKYLNSEMLWLDNAEEDGGKPWLNPYSDLARAYIIDISTEAISLGVDKILLDNVSFPTGYGQEYANYGNNAASQTRSEVLASFIDEMDRQITELNGEVGLYISGLAALGANNTYYGTNPLTLANTNVTIGAMPAQFGDGFTIGSFSVEAPVLNPRETVDALLKFIAPDTAGLQLTAMLQAYPASYTLENNKMYTADDINAQIGAAAANGIDNYIIYSPDGSYPGN